MQQTDKGVLLRSKPIPYSAGNTVNVDLSYLYSAMQRMRAPVVRELAFHFSGSISGVTGGFDNEDGCALFSKIAIRDRKGPIYDLPGKLARVLHQMEFGTRGDEIDGLADAASAATTTGDNMMIRVPFDLEYAKRGADTALPLLHLVEGGQIDLTFGTPAESTGATGTVKVYAVVHDEGKRELKSRLVRRAQAVTAREDHYPIGGSVRSLVLTSNPSTEGMSAWTAADYAALNVPQLELSAFESYILREEYRRLRPDYSAADEILAGAGIPLVVPSRGQGIGKMHDLKSIQIDIGSSTVPTSAQLLMEYIEDRDPILAAEWMGYADVNHFMAEFASKGVVRFSSGTQVKATAINARLARRLPGGFE
jgi:hypothetical protein